MSTLYNSSKSLFVLSYTLRKFLLTTFSSSFKLQHLKKNLLFTYDFFLSIMIIYITPFSIHDFPGGSNDKASAYNMGDQGSIPGSGRSPGEGNGNPLQHSCLENPMDGGAWQSTVHRVVKSRTRLSNFTFTSFLQHSVIDLSSHLKVEIITVIQFSHCLI